MLASRKASTTVITDYDDFGGQMCETVSRRQHHDPESNQFYILHPIETADNDNRNYVVKFYEVNNMYHIGEVGHTTLSNVTQIDWIDSSWSDEYPTQFCVNGDATVGDLPRFYQIDRDGKITQDKSKINTGRTQKETRSEYDIVRFNRLNNKLVTGGGSGQKGQKVIKVFDLASKSVKCTWKMNQDKSTGRIVSAQ